MKTNSTISAMFYNDAIEDAKTKHDVVRASVMLKNLHKLELKDGVKLGTYRRRMV